MIIVSAEIFILMGVATMALCAVSGYYFFRLFFSYEIREKDVLVRLFHLLPIYKVPFNKIVAIRKAPFHEIVLVPGMHLSTRLFARRVAIEMKDRWIIFVFLTPNEPDAFIAEVKKRQSVL